MVKSPASTVGGVSLIPGWETKIPNTALPKKGKKKNLCFCTVETNTTL